MMLTYDCGWNETRHCFLRNQTHCADLYRVIVHEFLTWLVSSFAMTGPTMPGMVAKVLVIPRRMPAYLQTQAHWLLIPDKPTTVWSTADMLTAFTITYLEFGGGGDNQRDMWTVMHVFIWRNNTTLTHDVLSWLKIISLTTWHATMIQIRIGL